jgi:SAM-dependent methyltransferase
MCHVSCINFTFDCLTAEEVKNRTILEVGSREAKGGVGHIIKSYGPAQYIGVDIEDGPGVDEICNALDLEERFGDGSFDIVISTEMLEHVFEWREAVTNLKKVVKPGGTLLLTTRSPGYPYHAAPHDHWRFTAGDMEKILSDFHIDVLEDDPEKPGIFIKATRPQDFSMKDLEKIEVYSMKSTARRTWLINRFNKDKRFIAGVAAGILLTWLLN